MLTIEQHAQALADRTHHQPRNWSSTASRGSRTRTAKARAPSSRSYGAGAGERRRDGQLRRAGRAPGRYAGIPISLKDLFDVAGEPTAAGCRVLADAPARGRARARRAALLAAGLVPWAGPT